MKTILLTGGAGFIGSHVADYLIDQGDKIVVVDNLILGKEQNIEHLIKHRYFTMINKDLSSYTNTFDIFKKFNFDVVFHFAANSDIQASQDNPAPDINNTFLTTLNILECMRRFQVKQLLFASSSAVYGNRPGINLGEDQGPILPVSYYGASKAASEAMISAYCHMNNMKSWILRFSNVVGERLTHGVVYDFIKKLQHNPRQLYILGDGKQTKPYLYIDDLLKAIFLVWHRTNQNVNYYNIGVETCTSVKRIADIICDEMGLSGVKYVYTGSKEGWPGDVASFKYDLSKICKLGWYPRFNSDDAIRYTVRRIIS